MRRSEHTRRLLLRGLTVAVFAAALPPASAGAAAIDSGGPGALSPELTLLTRPAVRAKPATQQARTIGLAAEGPGSLIRDRGRVLTETRFEEGAIARLGTLRAAGAGVVSASRSLQTVTASVAPADLERVGALPGVASVSPVRAPVVRAVETPEPCQGGSVISEGVEQLNVIGDETRAGAREKFPGLEGEGVTVGVLSDSFNQAEGTATDEEGDIAGKDLPGEANDCEDQGEPVDETQPLDTEAEGAAEPSDEGRAMVQIVHDVAPRASLAFASAFNGELAFAKAIEELGPAGVGSQVIVDDISYFEEPFFQEGPVAAAVGKVTAEGASYFSAAGNDNLFDAEGDEIASWEAPTFRDSGDCPEAVVALQGENGHHCMDFDPGSAVDRTFGIKVEPGGTVSVDLQWAEPRNGVETDLDAFLLDAEGNRIASATTDNVGKTQKPLEILQWENAGASTRTVQLAINRYAGTAPRLKFILQQNTGIEGIEYPRSGGGDVVGPSIYGHAGAEGAVAVGAVKYNDDSQPEEYSSRGPVMNLFGPVEVTEAAPPRASPQVLSKPDIAATDCGLTTFFDFEPEGEPGRWRFCGTSAAAPHAAGVAALAAQLDPAVEPSEVVAALEGTGSAVGAFGPCAAGGGLVEARGALEAIAGEATPVAPEECEGPEADGPVYVAPGFWGREDPPVPPPVEPVLPSPVPVPPVTAAPNRYEPIPTPASKPSVAPRTWIAAHPRKLLRTRQRRARVVFGFVADQPGVEFLCRVDRSRFRRCGGRLVRRLGSGRHVVRVKARNAAGQVDDSAAVFRFRVVRVHQWVRSRHS